VGLHSGYQDILTPPNWIKKGEALFVTRHIGAFVDFYVPGQRAYTIDYSGNKTVVVLDNMNSFLIAPSLDKEGYAVGTYSTITISDRRAFAQYYNNIGSQYLADGREGEAYRYFVKAIKADPELGFAWSNLGVVYSWNDQVDAAEKAYLQAVAINSSRDDTSLMTVMGNLAKLYSRTGRKEDAAFYENEVTSFRDKNPYYHFSLGSKAFDDGFIEESVKQFKDAIRKKDDEHLFYYALAISYVKLNDLKNAEKSLKKARLHALDSYQKDFYDRVLDNLHKNVAEYQKTAG
jgi:Flp pilus assembly protein TadD